MKLASHLFSAQDIARVEGAIRSAEASTSGEIIPAVATCSGRYDRAEDLFGIIFSLAVLSIVWFTYQASADAAWPGGPATSLGLPAIAAIVALGFVVGATLATHFPILRLPFIPSNELQAEVERAARATFHAHKLRNTANATGILIYVSLYERIVQVIGDDSVSTAIAQHEWDEICNAVVDGMQRDEPATGLVAGLEQAGVLLARALPRADSGGNELADKLLILD